MKPIFIFLIRFQQGLAPFWRALLGSGGRVVDFIRPALNTRLRRLRSTGWFAESGWLWGGWEDVIRGEKVAGTRLRRFCEKRGNGS